MLQTPGPVLQTLQSYLVFPAQAEYRNPYYHCELNSTVQLHLKSGTGRAGQNYTLAVLDYCAALYSRVSLDKVFTLRDILQSCLALTAGRYIYTSRADLRTDVATYLLSPAEHMTILTRVLIYYLQGSRVAACYGRLTAWGVRVPHHSLLLPAGRGGGGAAEPRLLLPPRPLPAAALLPGVV